MTNTLYYGDNLEILRQHVPDESVDLVYLDPPFNSNANYNVLFREQSGEESPAQIRAFTDTWEWTQEAERTYEQEIITNAGTPAIVKEMVSSIRQFIGSNAMMAYLVMMTPRLVELRRVLKPTGSIYLHCDPNAGPYLRLLMDTVFGKENFRTEIAWKRTSAHSDARQGRRQHGRVHDLILFYSVSDSWTWNQLYTEYDQDYIDEFYRHEEPETGRRYRLDNLTGPGGATKGNPSYEVMGVTRYWRYSEERMAELIDQGRIVQASPGAVPAYKRYLDEMPGIPLQDIWTDIGAYRVTGKGAPRLPHPEAAGPAGAHDQRVLQRGGRSARPILRLRHLRRGGGEPEAPLDGHRHHPPGRRPHEEPPEDRLRSPPPARTTGSSESPRTWAVPGRWPSRTATSSSTGPCPCWRLCPASRADAGGADRGIDGVLYFIDGPRRATKKAIVQVKSGRVSSPHVRDLKGTVEREKADLGLFITLEEPTREMRTEAASAGFYHSEIWQRDYPRMQIRTIADLLEGRDFDIPPHPSMYRPAQRLRRSEGSQITMTV